MSTGGFYLLAFVSVVGTFWALNRLWARFERQPQMSDIENPDVKAGAVPASSSATGLQWRVDKRRDAICARASLRSWRDFTCSNSAPDAQGVTVLRIADNTIEDPVAMDPRYHAAAEWLYNNDAQLNEAVVTAVWKHLPTIIRGMKNFGDDELVDELGLSKLRSPQGLRNAISLAEVVLFPHTKSGAPYFGINLDCEWDPEHGFKLLLNGSRVVGVEVDSCDDHTLVEGDGGSL